MRQPPSLALRLTLLFGMVATVVFSAFGWLIEDSIQRHFAIEDAKELKTIIQAVDDALQTDAKKDGRSSLASRFEDILIGHRGTSLYVADASGKEIYASADLDLSKHASSVNKIRDTRVQEWSNGRHNYRVLVQHIRNVTQHKNTSFTTVVAVPIDYHLNFLEQFRRSLWLMIISGIVLTAIMGWIAVRQGHAPLRQVVTQIRRISANELNTRLSPETLPKELTDVATSFNEMLAHIEQDFARLSNFSADIAHDLRTPVTSMMTQAQVALSRARSVNEYQEILYSNIEEYGRMAQMINDMLFLAKADNASDAKIFVSVNLASEVKTVFEYYEAWAEERKITLALEGTATTLGDPLMLRRVLSNLLSNAIRHTASDETVRVTLARISQREINLVVENFGPDIPIEHLPRLFDRFFRVDPTRQVGGTGLGLAIVKSIVDNHSGRIAVTSTGGVTKFKITLPALQQSKEIQ